MSYLLPIVAAAVILLMVPYLARAIFGPSLFDRLVSLNAMGTQLAVLLVLIGLIYRRLDMFIDIALALFLLNLVTTLLIARYTRERRTERST